MMSLLIIHCSPRSAGAARALSSLRDLAHFLSNKTSSAFRNITPHKKKVVKNDIVLRKPLFPSRKYF